MLADPEARALLLDDLLGELTDEVVRRSTLGVLLERHRPELVVDCINTATAFAYQNMFASSLALREAGCRMVAWPPSGKERSAILAQAQ